MPNFEVSAVISTFIPTCYPSDTFDHISKKIVESAWDDLNYVFVIDNSKHLLGVVDMSSANSFHKLYTADKLMKKVEIVAKSGDSRQQVVIAALKNDINIIPVVDDENKFVGAITSKTIIDIMHSEHLENFLVKSGISLGKNGNLSLPLSGIKDVLRFRIPWLLLGLFVGMLLGFISSLFETSISANIAIAYFIPVVAYIADSVGTQSEAITIRTLATLSVNHFSYILREFLSGICIGIIMGLFGALGAYVISSQINIATAVGLALFFSSTLAAVLASAIPILFKMFNKDPALGSGPLATAIQDTVSVIIYFIFVSILV